MYFRRRITKQAMLERMVNQHVEAPMVIKTELLPEDEFDRIFNPGYYRVRHVARALTKAARLPGKAAKAAWEKTQVL